MSRPSLKKEHNFLLLFEKFIRDCETGKRVQPNGKRLSSGTIKNYRSTFGLLQRFEEKQALTLRIVGWNRLSAREQEREKNYWKKFYKKFSDYLYGTAGCFDNYAGMCFKNIKVFFAYLARYQNLDTGNVHRFFYVRKEEIAIYPLLPEELNHLIYNEDLKVRLSLRLQQAKDFFVFGCTVALRFSDLAGLQKANLRVVGGEHYLAVQSKKTGTQSLMKLPAYAVEIVNRYKRQPRKLLPLFNNTNLNEYIKVVLEEAGFTQPISLSRERRGNRVFLKNKGGKELRFCDVASTHTMRRTAISTMLCLGMKEQLVRQISGHSPNGREFYRYVAWAQTYQDGECENVFRLLKEKQLTL